MRSFILTAAALGLCACALVACNPQDGSAPPGSSNSAGISQPATKQPANSPDQARRIGIAEAQQAVAAGTAIILDVRDEASYKIGHIKGASLIPISQFEQRMGELPPDKLIITYCA